MPARSLETRVHNGVQFTALLEVGMYSGAQSQSISDWQYPRQVAPTSVFFSAVPAALA